MIISLYFQSDMIDHGTQLQSDMTDHVTQLLSDLHDDGKVTLKLGNVIDHVVQL